MPEDVPASLATIQSTLDELTAKVGKPPSWKDWLPLGTAVLSGFVAILIANFNIESSEDKFRKELSEKIQAERRNTQLQLTKAVYDKKQAALLELHEYASQVAPVGVPVSTEAHSAFLQFCSRSTKGSLLFRIASHDKGQTSRLLTSIRELQQAGSEYFSLSPDDSNSDLVNEKLKALEEASSNVSDLLATKLGKDFQLDVDPIESPRFERPSSLKWEPAMTGSPAKSVQADVDSFFGTR